MGKLHFLCIFLGVVSSSYVSHLVLADDKNSTYDRYNACSNHYQLRPVSERMCLPGFECYYGKCHLNTTFSTHISVGCKCDSGSYGGLCQTKCCLDCGDYGECSHDENGDEFCSCFFNYTGNVCQYRRTFDLNNRSDADDIVVTVVWLCTGISVLFICVVVITLYLMWRCRVVLVLKLVRRFQPFDEDKLFDAFVSFKAGGRDEDFVLQKLYQEMEIKREYKLCIHHRDFVVGETIANNIINAIEDSNRTILVISKRYIDSEYTRFEYQVAQQKMLEKKHKIVPVLLEDISNCKEEIDPNLKVILNTVTYIEWPGDKNEKKMQTFWKRLDLSMPKKRNQSKSLKLLETDYDDANTILDKKFDIEKVYEQENKA